MQTIVFSTLILEVGHTVGHTVHTWHQFQSGQREGVGTRRQRPLRAIMEASLSKKLLQRGLLMIFVSGWMGLCVKSKGRSESIRACNKC